MKVTKKYESPKPPLAIGMVIEMDMVEAQRLRFSLQDVLRDAGRCSHIGAELEVREFYNRLVDGINEIK